MAHSSRLFSAVRQSAPWLALALGVFYSSRAFSPSATFPIGTKLPAFSTPLTDGTPFAVTGAAAQVTVLNFWASYCGPCRAEAPLLSAAQTSDTRVIGLSIEDMPVAETLLRARELGMTYPIGVADRALLARFDVRAVPTTYVIARDGVIVLSRVGAITRGELEAALASARRRAS